LDLFITNKFGDLSVQELKPWEITGSSIDRIPLILAQVNLVIDAQLGHGFNAFWEAESDPSGNKADYHGIACPIVADPIHQPPVDSNSNDGREVYMVGQGEPANKTAEEITRDAEEEIACVAQLVREAAGKRHNGQKDESSSSGDDARDGAPSGGTT
jgi:hypothetical protein